MSGRRVALGAALAFLVGTAAQAGNVTKIRDVGPDSNRLVLAIVGDGYRAAEEATFDADAQQALAGFLATSPYSEYAAYFNVYTDFVASNESGADKPAACFGAPVDRDTAFDATYCTSNIRRLLTVRNSLVFAELNAAVPTWDLAAIVVNDAEYGGSGGASLVFSTDAGAMIELFTHEAGHTFARLADEYGGDPGVGRSAPEVNVTVETDPALVEWEPWIEPGTPVPTPPGMIGLFEGGRYFDRGIYRPVDRCKMRVLNREFGSVCKEAHVQRLYTFVSPIDGELPAEGPVDVDPCSSLDFEVVPMLPEPQTLEATWTLDGAPISGASGYRITLDGGTLSGPTHALRVELADRTELVRRPFLTPMTDRRDWLLTLLGSPGDADSDGVADACDPCPFDAEDDADSDGHCADDDVCPEDSDPDQRDEDEDGAGDACDPCPLDPQDDADSDGHCADDDLCPEVADPDQLDGDSDGAGDACDPCPLNPQDDADSDGYCAEEDNCPEVANADQEDLDSDGQGDPCDDDRDGDLVPNDGDCAPDEPLVSEPAAAVTGLRGLHEAPRRAHFTWDDRLAGGARPGALYGVLSGTLGELRADRSFAAVCALGSPLDAALDDDREGRPSPPDGWYYLVLVNDACGAGALGPALPSGAGDARSAIDWATLPVCP